MKGDMKRFKRQSDLIKCAVQHTIHRVDVEIPARIKVFSDDYFIRHPPDFLQQAKQKLGMPK